MVFGKTLLFCSLSATALASSGGHIQVGMHKFALREAPPQKPLSGSTKIPIIMTIFNPRFAQRELKKVLIKYEQASDLLQGIGLSPQLDIPLAKSFPPFQDPNTVLAFSKELNESAASTSHDTGPPLVPPVSLPFAALPLNDFISNGLDVLYYGTVEIGTPSQPLTVDIDTGSADLWIASNCTGCEVDQFDSTASGTFRDKTENFSIAYGAGEVFGVLGEDVVSVAGLTYEKQTFGLVDTESHDFDGYPNSGILGLGFGSIATSGEPTLFENLMASGRVLAPFFSVHQERGKNTGSEVCLGCYNISKAKGPVAWVPVESKTYWTVAMNGLRIASTSVKTNIVAAIDTGTTLIYVPDQAAKAFYKRIPGAKEIHQFGPGFFTYPCASKLDIAFVFGELDFAIDQRDFNMGRVAANSADCVGGVLSLGDGFPDNIAIIGDEFLKSWYTVYDYSNGARVGFAPSINNA